MNESEALSVSQAMDATSLVSWIKALVYLGVGFVAAKYARQMVSKVTTSNITPHHQALLKRVVYYGILVLFIVSSLNELGFQLGVLLGAAGIVTVALGFASQTSASNLISGLFLLGERPFQIGDIILVDNARGQVISIDLLSIKLRTPDNLFVRIPNETIIKTTVTNVSRFPIRRLDLKIGVAYKEDIAKVRALLLQIAEEHTKSLIDPKPFCVVVDFAASSVDLQFSTWCKNEDFLTYKDEMMEEIKARFDAEDIEIPFPHTTVFAGTTSEPFKLSIVDSNLKEQS